MSDEFAVQQVLARYVRAADARNGPAMAELFVSEGRVQIFYNHAGTPELIGELSGRGAISDAVTRMLRPHPARGWSHHTTHDPIIEVEGERASLDAQFVVFNAVGSEKPATGWPKDAFGLQGTVTSAESGYYRPLLRRIEGRWMIETLRIILDLPMAMPEPGQ